MAYVKDVNAEEFYCIYKLLENQLNGHWVLYE